MKQVKIYTHRYKSLLEEFVNSICLPDETVTIHKKSGLFFVYQDFYQPIVMEKLMSLLIEIALQENPLYQQSPKLREMAGELHGMPLYMSMQKSLNRFIKASRTLHLEGYVTFRMAEYREKLDIMSYSLIKKMKLSIKD
ncbi:MAG: hypothetical protein FWE42_06370 [Defluviitaleaceae bacterium]|nr:hypothetical protein [Defluviitaleaceae bacterium]